MITVPLVTDFGCRSSPVFLKIRVALLGALLHFALHGNGRRERLFLHRVFPDLDELFSHLSINDAVVLVPLVSAVAALARPGLEHIHHKLAASVGVFCKPRWLSCGPSQWTR